MVEADRHRDGGERKLEVATPQREEEEQRRSHGETMAPAEVERHRVGAALEHEAKPGNAAPEHIRTHEI